MASKTPVAEPVAEPEAAAEPEPEAEMSPEEKRLRRELARMWPDQYEVR